MYSPSDSPAVLSAANWLEALMLGTTATGVSVISVAAVGFLLWQGRLPVGRSVTVILGCFLLFGAPIIAAGIQYSAVALDDGEAQTARPSPAASATMVPGFQAPQDLAGNERYASPTVTH